MNELSADMNVKATRTVEASAPAPDSASVDQILMQQIAAGEEAALCS